ncbi:receptor tyrosine-protein kinase erbB-3 [Platysternon megacephalum]|uniref:Receptor tyrosine-protein kinase erbB-3 n=1 Tax=Platysternon megacephalum TaxID=55544 RepID=A0A4D9E1A5_9SAUR|nr:receptor tyrosine-protein kinase erbB-3 [Platysternon megacephalum]
MSSCPSRPSVPQAGSLIFPSSPFPFPYVTLEITIPPLMQAHNQGSDPAFSPDLHMQTMATSYCISLQSMSEIRLSTSGRDSLCLAPLRYIKNAAAPTHHLDHINSLHPTSASLLSSVQ